LPIDPSILKPVKEQPKAALPDSTFVPRWSASMLGIWIAIFCVTFIAYFPALRGGFLWDDDGHVCPIGLRSLQGLWRIWSELGATQQYYPILHSAFWLEYRIWGEATIGYHLLNVFLHAGSACFVIAIMRRLALPGAVLAGFIFALHPVAVESVAWISEQKNTLSTLLYLGSVFAYLQFDHDRSRRQYGLALGLFVLALLTKSVTATLPVALFAILWLQRGHLNWRRDIAPLVPWVVIGAGSGLFTAWVEKWVVGAQGADFALTITQRCLLAGRVVWFYLFKLVWPTNLSFIYPRWTLDPTVAWQYLFPSGLLVAGASLWILRQRQRGLAAAFIIYVATLFPVLGFFNIYPFSFSFAADHFQYLASMSMIVLAAAGLTSAAKRMPFVAANRLFFGVALLLLTTLGVLTWRQASLYRDAETLYRATLARNPDCWLAHNNLGNILLLSPERTPEAIDHFEAALRIKPDFAEAHFNLGIAFAKIPSRRPESFAHYEAAIRFNSRSAEAHNNFGTLLAQDPARLIDAVRHFQTAIEISPEFAAAHANLGTAWSRIPGHLADAIAQYKTVISLSPESAEAHYNLANALAKDPANQTGAIAAYRNAIQINPDSAEAHYNLATILYKTPGGRADAIAHYEQALRVRPDWDFVRQILEQNPSEQR
jgi:tetratricopeptide (TPR) repeat protein